MLRLDWNLLFNIINLIILYVCMKKFLFGPVQRILTRRQAEADCRFAQADDREAEARESRQKYEALLEEAEGERKQMTALARQKASREYGRMMDEARSQAEEIVEKARQDAENERDEILRQADLAVKELVVDAAAKMMGEAESPCRNQALYDQFLEKADS